MRLSRNRIRARVKTDLPITFSEERISAHAGLELFRRYFGAIDLVGRLREAFRGLAAEGDYGAVRFVLWLEIPTWKLRKEVVVYRKQVSHRSRKSFQLALGAPRRTNGWKRTYRYVFESLQTLRFTLIQQPARIVRPGGRPELRFAVSDTPRRRIEHVQRRIALAA